jgi:thiol-disulfide isomerase/thioredoxin
LGGAGRKLRIAELPGEVKVVNIWATNCPPCVAEMPTLAALQRLEGPRVHVAAVSLDPVGRQDRARAFIAKHPPLAFYSDPTFGTAVALKAQGMPTTIIFDRQGRERARLAGAAEWDSPEARKLMAAILAE